MLFCTMVYSKNNGNQIYVFIIIIKRSIDWIVGPLFPGQKLKDLIADVYEKASTRKMWWLVRHSAGMLGLKTEELAKVGHFLTFFS